MRADVESRVLPLGVGTGTHPVFRVVRARLSDGVLHLGDDLNSAHTGTGDVYHRLEPDVSETGGVSDELKLFRRLDGPQLRHDVVATHEVFAPLGAQVFVEGDGHGCRRLRRQRAR